MRQELLRRIASGDTAFRFEIPEGKTDMPYTLVRKDGYIVAVVHHPAYENWSDRFLDAEDKYVAVFKKKGRMNFFCVTLYEEDIAWTNHHPFEQELLIAETCSVIAKQFAEVHELSLTRTRGLASANLTVGDLVVYKDGTPSVRRKTKGNKVIEVFIGNIPVAACEYRDKPVTFPLVRRWENPCVFKGDTDAVFVRLMRLFKHLYE